MSKISKTQAILTAKCPNCREGNLFEGSKMSFKNLTAINHSCPVCNANLMPEPGFYDGALYISYAFSVALVITVLVALNVLFKRPELWMYLTTIFVGNVLLLPLMLRYSKVLYLYLVSKLKYRGY
ncbi:MAG: DUF983 domain-containing protein [Algoriphagus sp.]|uniref:DUF983 domain-containing protein n=1 Tax=Algoriphagus sp. TaxID=1872435 RepID=UPI0026221445|nr:DUF983 domain-containing protein [Algoriphagus sp.]MDG1277227.1 DUF983 domain-containing protein [Algoriphagus sp.]